MEDLSDLGDRGHLGAARRPAAPSFPSSSKVSVQVYTVPSSSAAGGEAARAQGGVAPMIHATSSVSGHGGCAADLDPIKAKIVSHPRYHRLLAAFLDCHKAHDPIDVPSIFTRVHVFIPVASCCCCPSYSLLLHVFMLLRSAARRKRPRRSRRRLGSARRGSVQPWATRTIQGRTRSSTSSWWSTKHACMLVHDETDDTLSSSLGSCIWPHMRIRDLEEANS